MKKSSCPSCGYPLNQGQTFCPECGSQINWPETPVTQNITGDYQNNQNTPSYYNSSQPLSTWKTDKAEYIYECWIIAWKSFGRIFRFRGRASRREFWSYYIFTGMILNIIPGLGTILWLLGLWSVSVRRMHDSNHSGWWILVPFHCLFLYFKKSDEDDNRYGEPEPATDFLEY